jgi:hypothetical protein
MELGMRGVKGDLEWGIGRDYLLPAQRRWPAQSEMSARRAGRRQEGRLVEGRVFFVNHTYIQPI